MLKLSKVSLHFITNSDASKKCINVLVLGLDLTDLMFNSFYPINYILP